MNPQPATGNRILQDGWGCWVVAMRGKAGYFCLVRVSCISARTLEEARCRAVVMFPELSLDETGVDAHQLSR